MDKKGLLLVCSGATIWGFAGVFVRALNSFGITSMNIVFGRAMITVVFLALLMLIIDRDAFRISLRHLWLFAANGILSIAMFNYCYYQTMKYTSLSVAAVLMYTAPFFVVVISAIFFKERLTVKKGVACIVAFIGCCMVSGLVGSDHSISGKGLAFGLMTGFGYALYTVFGNMLLKRGYSSLTITFYSFAFSFLGSALLSDTVKTSVSIFTRPQVLGVFAAMAVFNTIIPYILYTNGLDRIEASIAPIIATIEPVAATVVGLLLFKEIPDIWGFLGIAVVLAAVVILNYTPKQRGDTAWKK